MLLDTRKSMAATGAYHTRTAAISRAIAATGSLHTLLVGVAIGLGLAGDFGHAALVLAPLAILWFIIYFAFIQRSLGAAVREVTALSQDQAVARGRVLQSALAEDVFRAAAEAQFTAEEHGLRTSSHLRRIFQGRGLMGWHYRSIERKMLKDVRAAYQDDSISLSSLDPHTWQGLSNVSDVHGPASDGIRQK